MKNIKRNISLLKWFSFVKEFYLFNAIAILYFAQVSGSYTLGMSVFSIIFASQAIFEVPTGVLSDKVLHRKGSMVCGAVVAFLSVLLYGMANNYYWLVAGSILEGLGYAFLSGTDSALLYETLKDKNNEEEFADYQGKVCFMSAIALFLASLLGAVALLYSYRLAIYLTLIPKFFQIVISLFLIEPKRHTHKFEPNVLSHTKEAFALFKKNKKLLWITIGNSVGFGFGHAGYYFHGAFLKTIIPEWAISLVKSFMNLAASIGFWFAGKIIKIFGEFKVLVIGTFLQSVIDLIALLSQNIISLFLFPITSGLFGILLTAKGSAMQKEFSDKQRATMGSFVSVFGSIAFVFASLLIGYIADLHGVMIALLVAYVGARIIEFSVYWNALKPNK